VTKVREKNIEKSTVLGGVQ